MAKRYSILAAALVASGRSLSTTALGQPSGSPPQGRPRESDVFLVPEPSSPTFDGLDEALLRFDLANSGRLRPMTWAA